MTVPSGLYESWVAGRNFGDPHYEYLKYNNLVHGVKQDFADVQGQIDAITAAGPNGTISVYAAEDVTNTNDYVDSFGTPFALFDRLRVNLKVTNKNDGPATFDYNSTGAVDIVDRQGTELKGGELQGTNELEYDNANSRWVALNYDVPTYIPTTTHSAIADILSTVFSGSISDGAGDALEIEGVSVVNLLDNADFSDGIDNWDYAGISQFYAIDNIATVVFSATFGNVRQPLNLVDGHEYFMVAYVRSTQSTTYISFNGSDKVYHSGDGFYEELYQRVTASSNTQFEVVDSAGNNGNTINIDGKYGVKVLDLTALGQTGLSDEELLSICSNGNIDKLEGLKNITIDTIGKNIHPMPNFEGNVGTTLWAYYQPDGTWSNNGDTALRIPVEPGETYFVSGTMEEGTGYQFLSVDPYPVTAKGLSGTIVWDAPYVLLRVRNTVDGSIKFTDCQLEKSTVKTDYEPRKTDQLRIPESFHSLPDGTKDLLTIRNGEVWKYKAIEEYELKAEDIVEIGFTGTNIDKYRTSANFFSDAVTFGSAPNGQALTDYLEGTGLDVTTDEWTFNAQSDGKFSFSVPANEYDSLTEAQQALKDTKILYKLAEPYWERLGVNGSLKVFKDGHIYNSAEQLLGKVTLNCPANTSAVIEGEKYATLANKKYQDNPIPMAEPLKMFRSVMGSPLMALTGGISDYKNKPALSMTGLTLQNSIVNGGDFVNVDGWSPRTNNTAISASGGKMLIDIFVESGTFSYARQTAIKPSTNYFAYVVAEVDNADCTKIRLNYFTGSVDIDFCAVENPNQDQVYEMSGRLAVGASTAGDLIYLRHDYASAVGTLNKTMKVSTVNLLDLDALNLNGKTDAELLDICRQGYINGAQSIENPVVKTVGKNLFDGEVVFGRRLQVGQDYGVNTAVASTRAYTLNPILVDADRTLSVRANVNDGGFDISGLDGIYYYDRNLSYIGRIFSYDNVQPPANTRYIGVNFDDTNTIYSVECMVEIDGSALNYEPHQSDQCRYSVTLGSVPSGAEDKLIHSDAKVIKQKEVETYVLKESDITTISNGSNVAFVRIELPGDYKSSGVNSGIDAKRVIFSRCSWKAFADDVSTEETFHYFTDGNGDISYVVDLSKYASLAEAQADIAGEVMVYELATPTTEEVSTSAELTIFKDGYVFNTSDTFFGELEIQCPTNLASVQKGYEYGVRANKNITDKRYSYVLKNETANPLIVGSGFTASTTVARVSIQLPKQLQDTPSVTLTDLGGGVCRIVWNGSFATVTPDILSVVQLDDNRLELIVTFSSATLNANYPCCLWLTNYELKFEV